MRNGANGAAAALIRRGEAEAGTWRFRLDEDGWRGLVDALRDDPLPFVGLWSDGRDVHALFLDGGAHPLVASVAPETGRYLGLSSVRPAASLPERCLHDLWGIAAMDARDVRPWLDHGVWTSTWPLGARPGPVSWPPDPPEFRPVPAVARAGGMVQGIGPADGLPQAPGHLRLGLAGGGIAGAEWRLGYAHRGLVARLCGMEPAAAARLAGRAAAGASVAHQAALCRAIEAATDTAIGADAVRCRVILAEIERIATHLHDLSRIGRAAGASALAACCERLREETLHLCGRMFGHRMLMDLVVPGGMLEGDVATIGAVAGQVAGRGDDMLREIRRHLAWPGLAGRVRGCGTLTEAMARALGVGGVVGRASAREDDVRRLEPGYRREWLDSGVRGDGDVAARIDQRLAEIGGSCRMLAAARRDWVPDGAPRSAVRERAGEGIGCAEGPRGAVWYWVRVADGAVQAAFPRDPALAHVAALEHVLDGADPEDADLIVRSFGLSAAAADL
ncbi:NADH-ubiquinone oxidoreductase 49kDa subunit [Gluconacetobacter johannae DSM 13595]|uniref:Ni Fe-hydrogenase III large subunit-like protein n=1 Tax=Gluconacetobacter johannae TaxID=112140 RepID=A0A7W4J9B2_9PROT|nr:Ni Fe-hydrogenase III large subunit-like protein [Gluconacetobacter johannae]MBB2177076.1 Ni Fe-hydrogenase III large subunit-like protein [Gluconacetobacter johannae]GBQ90248.1 NADH-ubiquinone oxidoreductase 49kDa subunit [Gluconacetobacter johannae DSM 13595]